MRICPLLGALVSYWLPLVPVGPWVGTFACPCLLLPQEHMSALFPQPRPWSLPGPWIGRVMGEGLSRGPCCHLTTVALMSPQISMAEPYCSHGPGSPHGSFFYLQQLLPQIEKSPLPQQEGEGEVSTVGNGRRTQGSERAGLFSKPKRKRYMCRMGPEQQVWIKPRPASRPGTAGYYGPPASWALMPQGCWGPALASSRCPQAGCAPTCPDRSLR